MDIIFYFTYTFIYNYHKYLQSTLVNNLVNFWGELNIMATILTLLSSFRRSSLCLRSSIIAVVKDTKNHFNYIC